MNLQQLAQLLTTQLPESEVDEVTVKFSNPGAILTGACFAASAGMYANDQLLSLDFRISSDSIVLTFAPRANPAIPQEENHGTEEEAQLE